MNKLTLFEEIHRIRNLNEQINHIYQPTGNSCGPTCIKMVGDFLVGDIGKIDDICKACGTDWVVGTPPDRMKIGLDKLGIKYIEHINEVDPFQSIKNTIDGGNIAIVRTITHNIPHWIVIDGYDEKKYRINDPWLGPITYTEDELDKIWRIRDFFYFEIIGKNKESVNDIIIRKLTKSDIMVISDRLADVFSRTGLSNEEILDEIAGYDLNLSVCIDVSGKLAGFYLLRSRNIPKGGKDYRRFRRLRGLEGIALGVFPEYKNMGIGKRLIEYPRTISGYDYIWGMQFKNLRNIDDWLKRRKIYRETDYIYITYEIFDKQ